MSRSSATALSLPAPSSAHHGRVDLEGFTALIFSACRTSHGNRHSDNPNALSSITPARGAASSADQWPVERQMDHHLLQGPQPGDRPLLDAGQCDRLDTHAAEDQRRSGGNRQSRMHGLKATTAASLGAKADIGARGGLGDSETSGLPPRPRDRRRPWPPVCSAVMSFSPAEARFHILELRLDLGLDRPRRPRRAHVAGRTPASISPAAMRRFQRPRAFCRHRARLTAPRAAGSLRTRGRFLPSPSARPRPRCHRLRRFPRPRSAAPRRGSPALPPAAPTPGTCSAGSATVRRSARPSSLTAPRCTISKAPSSCARLRAVRACSPSARRRRARRARKAVAVSMVLPRPSDRRNGRPRRRDRSRRKPLSPAACVHRHRSRSGASAWRDRLRDRGQVLAGVDPHVGVDLVLCSAPRSAAVRCPRSSAPQRRAPLSSPAAAALIGLSSGSRGIASSIVAPRRSRRRRARLIGAARALDRAHRTRTAKSSPHRRRLRTRRP